MAKQVTLVDSYMYKGKQFGPGQVTPPDDDFVKLVTPKEKALIARLTAEGQAAAALLPSGHPYHVLLGVMAQQPPQFDGEATQIAQPLVITTAETELLSSQQGEGDTGLAVPDANVDASALSNTGNAGSAPGTPVPAGSPRVVIRENNTTPPS